MHIQTIDALLITIGALMVLAGPVLEWKFRQYVTTKQSFFTSASLRPKGSKIIDDIILSVTPMLTLTGVAVLFTGLYFYKF